MQVKELPEEIESDAWSSLSPGMLIELPEYLIENLPEGTHIHLLSYDADGRFKVAKRGDWVVGVAVNLGIPECRCIEIVGPYRV